MYCFVMLLRMYMYMYMYFIIIVLLWTTLMRAVLMSLMAFSSQNLIPSMTRYMIMYVHVLGM